jgi:hypothetical protein
MTPLFRRNGILAGLALSALCALGFVQRSSHEWAMRWEVEAEARETREAELEAAKLERNAEMELMQRRVALLESELAREREVRASAEERAASAEKPSAELEAAKAELERAYGRIGQLEAGDAIVRLATPGCEMEVGVFVEEKHCGRIRACASDLLREDVARRSGKLEAIEDPVSANVDGALNQGVDYVDPSEEVVLEPIDVVIREESWGEPLNQGTSYVEREAPASQEDMKKKIEAIRHLIGEMQEAQREQLTLTEKQK